ncbi:hypothetical protein HN784_03350 [bacterium]|nr:hypothetical protein [bacterium]MBT4251331.1 hypothetical protein [bacterium]MBT4598288.1 hypothetical protein [bacterium]MBT6754121.1 hypothetical protein [bacterium]MBT7037941.1 hypothetical protein [bacterium]
MRIIILLVPIACGLVAFTNFIERDFFEFFLWSFAAAMLFLAILPITFDSDKKAVPVYQIFGALLVLLAIIPAITYFDVLKLKISTINALIYSGIFGFVITSILVIIRPKS